MAFFGLKTRELEREKLARECAEDRERRTADRWREMEQAYKERIDGLKERGTEYRDRAEAAEWRVQELEMELAGMKADPMVYTVYGVPGWDDEGVKVTAVREYADEKALELFDREGKLVAEFREYAGYSKRPGIFSGEIGRFEGITILPEDEES